MKILLLLLLLLLSMMLGMEGLRCSSRVVFRRLRWGLGRVVPSLSSTEINLTTADLTGHDWRKR